MKIAGKFFKIRDQRYVCTCVIDITAEACISTVGVEVKMFSADLMSCFDCVNTKTLCCCGFCHRAFNASDRHVAPLKVYKTKSYV